MLGTIVGRVIAGIIKGFKSIVAFALIIAFVHFIIPAQLDFIKGLSVTLGNVSLGLIAIAVIASIVIGIANRSKLNDPEVVEKPMVRQGILTKMIFPVVATGYTIGISLSIWSAYGIMTLIV